MIITEHGRKRCAERAIPLEVVALLHAFGREVRSYGCSKFYLDKAARRQLARTLGTLAMRKYERKFNTMIVVSDEGELVTAAYRTRRIKH